MLQVLNLGSRPEIRGPKVLKLSALFHPESANCLKYGWEQRFDAKFRIEGISDGTGN